MEQREGYKKTKICWIPEDWELKQIGNVCAVKGGKRIPKGSKLMDEDTGFPYIRVADMFMGGIKTNDLKFVPKNVVSKIARYTIGKNDLFISVAGTLGIAGEVPDILDGANLTENADKLTEITCDRKFLLHILKSHIIQSVIKREATLNALPKLAIQRIKNFDLPTPPLPEQKKIASILTTVDDKISSVDQQIQQTEQLKKGLMEKLLTEGLGHTEFKETKIGRMPKGWGAIRLKNIGSLQGGYALKSKSFNDEGTGYQVVRMSNVQSVGLYLEKTPVFMAEIDDKMKPFILNIGGILITLTGTIGKTDYGHVALIKSDKKLLLNQRVARFILNSNAHNEFMFYVFRFNHFRNHFFSFGKGGTGNQANVGKQNFESIPIGLPPIDEQKQIATILSTVDDKIEVLNQKKTQYQTLKKGLSQQLLTGQMRVKI